MRSMHMVLVLAYIGTPHSLAAAIKVLHHLSYAACWLVDVLEWRIAG